MHVFPPPRVFCLLVLFCTATTATAQDMPLTQVLIDGQGWELVGKGYRFTEGPAATSDGVVYFVDVPSSRIYKVDAAGKVSVFAENTNRASGLAIGKNGTIYACQNGAQRIGKYDKTGKFQLIASGIPCNDIAVSARNEIFVTDPKNGQVWLIKPDGSKRVVAKGLKPNGIIVWPRAGTLVVTDRDEPVLWTFRINADGTLDAKEPYYAPLRIPPGKDRPGSDGMAMDNAGRLYVATYAGLQMFDPTGRKGGVILKPQEKFLSNVCFGGTGGKYLYVTCADKVYRRKVKPKGIVPPAK